MDLTTAVLYVEDGTVPAVLEFYERALGLTRRFYDPEYQYGELVSGSATVAVAAHAAGARMMPATYRAPAQGAPVQNVELAFTTTDVEGAYARAVAAGAVALAAPYVLPWGQAVAYVRAPEGTLVGFCAPLPESASSAVREQGESDQGHR